MMLTMKGAAKLIILRGPSGSGKSTTAKKLFEQAARPTAFIEQDHYRFIFKPAGGKRNSKTIHTMIRDNILSALEDGYDVITEGIYNRRSYQATFAEIFVKHPANNYIFYFDISFEETLRRHRTKPNKDEWSEADMKDWYQPHDFLGYDFEHNIPETSTARQIFTYIKTTAKI